MTDGAKFVALFTWTCGVIISSFLCQSIGHYYNHDSWGLGVWAVIACFMTFWMISIVGKE